MVICNTCDLIADDVSLELDASTFPAQKEKKNEEKRDVMQRKAKEKLETEIDTNCTNTVETNRVSVATC